MTLPDRPVSSRRCLAEGSIIAPLEVASATEIVPQLTRVPARFPAMSSEIPYSAIAEVREITRTDFKSAYYATYLESAGKLDDALRELETARELDPLSTSPINLLALCYFFRRDYDKALEQWRKSLEISPNSAIAHWNLFSVYMAKSMPGEAIRELEQRLKLKGRTDDAKRISESYQHGGWREALRVLAQISEKPASKSYDPWEVATVYSYLGDKDQAFAWLRKAIEARTSFVDYLRVDPSWDNIRSDPRFAELVRRTGLPE